MGEVGKSVFRGANDGKTEWKVPRLPDIDTPEGLPITRDIITSPSPSPQFHHRLVMASSMYEVHVYHINIDIGDSAIYLLVETLSTSFQVIHAVLLDGGLTGGKAAILQTINRINTGIGNTPHYTFTNNQTSLQFDSIIISHW